MRLADGLCAFVSASLLTAAASAKDLDIQQPMICATLRAMTCEAEADCKATPIEAVNAPRFMRINLAERTIVSDRSGGGDRTTAIEAAQMGDDRLLLVGFENGAEGEIAWNLVVGRDTGKMTLAVAADDVGFLVSGACTSAAAAPQAMSGSSQAAGPDRAALAASLDELRGQHDQLVFKVMQLDQQAEASFRPLYAEYRKRMVAANDKAVALLVDYVENYQSLTDEQARAMSDRFIAYEAEKQSVREDLLPRFKDSLPPKSFARFIQAENKIDAATSFAISRAVPLVR